MAGGFFVGSWGGVGGGGWRGWGTSLAWLAGPGEAYAGGLLVGLLGAGAGAEGQRLQVAAQQPPAGALAPNMKAEWHLPMEACNREHRQNCICHVSQSAEFGL